AFKKYPPDRMQPLIFGKKEPPIPNSDTILEEGCTERGKKQILGAFWNNLLSGKFLDGKE
ncbi:hypothetical protein, partial [Bacteroides heparinolyticus]|uniref:hypothetical protein n=1 Tax=Prevotella heparinolytica TaxID=28113 RepID=UPI00359FCB05